MNRQQAVVPVAAAETPAATHDVPGWQDSPCFACGACCRYPRVSFYHGELDSQPGGYVPADYTIPLTPFRACMRGTEQGRGRCVALREDLSCAIYASRPSPCREFPVLLADGTPNPECDRLRRLLGMAGRAGEGS